MFLVSSRPFTRSRTTPGCCSSVELVIWLWIACTVATLATSQQNFYTNGRYGKRQDPGRVSSFWSGSRYGRSGSAASGTVQKSDTPGKDVEVSPRIDRFFLGSRYGKRTFSNDQSVDSLKHFETSLDFLISVDHQTTEKEQLKILTQELQNDDNFITLRSADADGSTLMKSDARPGYGFACLYTGITNLYRCFHRRTNTTQ